MALDFPSSPTNGQVFNQYVYNSTTGAWKNYNDNAVVPSALLGKANLSGGNTFTGNQIINSGYLTSNSTPHISGRMTGTSGSGAANSFTIRRQVGITIGSSTNLTAPVAGVYAIGFNTISTNTTGRVDAGININGVRFNSALTEDNGTGFHYKSLHIQVYLAANDYVTLVNDNWYDPSNNNTEWKTFYMTLIS